MSTLSIARSVVAAPVIVGSLVATLTLSEPAQASAVEVGSTVVLQAAEKPGPSFTIARPVEISAAPTAYLPVSNYRLTGTFGAAGSLWASTHTGLDFAAPHGSEIRAVQGGEVVQTYYDGAYGNTTVIRDADGTEWWYCHQDSFSVAVGEHVAAGEAIGAVGSTGNSTGPHLHLEVHPHAGAPVDPYAALEELGLQA